MKEKVTLTKKEQSRLMVLNGVEVGRISAREAAEVLSLSLRHVRRILAAYRKEGAAGLAHGNRGRKPHNALNDERKKRVLDLAQSTYVGCNTQHLTELLARTGGYYCFPLCGASDPPWGRVEESSQETSSKTL
jgi:transposase